MSALLLQKIFDSVGLKDIYCNLIIDLTQTERLIEDLRVKGVSLTGSSRAGSAVGKIAGANLKPVLLELGGSDVFIVEDDVNVHEVVKFAISARLQNNGQSCIAAKRFLISESVFESFKKELIDALQDVKIGDPLNEQVGLGPLARLDLKQGFEHQLIKSKEVGAKSVFVKVHGQAKGFYVNLEVLELEDENNSLFKEEVFGPCFVLKKIKDLDEAISIANNSIYGLSASIWTSNREKQNKAILGIESGAVFVNAVSRSYAGLPFGGIKQSGMGRELGEEGIKAFVNKKLVVIA